MRAQQTLNGHQVRSERSTRLLLRAAGTLVAEGGYQSMTLATVGERAGYSRSLATARFGSKAKLLEALVEEIVVRWDVETVEPEVHDLSGLDALRVMLTEIKNAYEKSPQSLTTLYALIFEAVGPVPELRDRFIDFHRNQRSRIAAYIHSGLLDGSIRAGVNPAEQAAMIVAQLRGVGYLWKLEPDGINSGAVLTTFIDQVVNHLAAEPTRQLSTPRPSLDS
ncbi:TetR/AcrR family transcriptional regulator (plasmid) [Rhodococcus erythropolis]|uniref:TetR/AcrR family transcriptional regulator n=1 Tax=Rhodococcus erythropolis TaxID=1833 RepID=UPI00406BBA36